MKYSPDEKYEIIRMVEQSDLGVERTLKKIGIPKARFTCGITSTLSTG
jgi:putative transposase